MLNWQFIHCYTSSLFGTSSPSYLNSNTGPNPALGPKAIKTMAYIMEEEKAVPAAGRRRGVIELFALALCGRSQSCAAAIITSQQLLTCKGGERVVCVCGDRAAQSGTTPTS